MFINYAHRGASQYAPENTFSAFYLAAELGATGIQTDLNITKDGKLVLFHDDTIDRVTNRSGKVSDYTYDELYKIDILGGENKSKNDRVVLFEDFLKYFSFKNIKFALSIKFSGIEEKVIDLSEKYNLSEKTVITTSDLNIIDKLKSYAPQYKLGYLGMDFDVELLLSLISRGVYELCPPAARVTKQLVDEWHERGFNIRPFGVSTPEIMKSNYSDGVDGLCVDFPDILAKYLLEERS